MRRLRLIGLAAVCLVLCGGPGALQAARTGGEATNIIEDVCYWRCYSGSIGSATMSQPSGKACLNLCRDACGGPCIALY